MTVLNASLIAAASAIGIAAAINMTMPNAENNTMDQQSKAPAHAGSKSLYVAGGCFWCLEPLFESLKGVYESESGYAGGKKTGVTYEEVCSGMSGHAETVRVVYNPKEISAEDLLRVFLTIHDPTTLNRQGGDMGTQYRSAIFYTNEEEKHTAEKIRDEIAKAKIWKNPIVTEIAPLKNWTVAEAYHQDYYNTFQNAPATKQMSMNAGYCRAIIEPKVIEFRKKFAEKLKKGN